MNDAKQPPSIAIGPRVRKSPFFDATLRYGAKAFTIYNHMFMPTAYSDVVQEYESLVNDVTLWDVACQRQVEISGPDAFRLIQLLTPRDMSRCRVGQCQYLVLTGSDGGIINDAVMLRLADQQFWLSPGDGDVLLWVEGVVAHSALDVRVFEPDVSPLQLQGPKSPYLAHRLFGDAILSLGYYRLTETNLDGIPLVVSRTGWSGELGYELYLRDSRFGEALWERIMDAGRAYGIVPIAPNLIRSVEGGLLSYRSDITRADNPFVIGFDRFIDLEQSADFIGQKALRQIAAEGAARKLVGIEFRGKPVTFGNSEFYPVVRQGKVVGQVTRCVHSPRLARNIGFANVPAELAANGTLLTLICPEGEVDVTVCAWPWVAAKKALPADLLEKIGSAAGVNER